MKVELSKYDNSWYRKEMNVSSVKLFVWYYVNLFLFNSYWFPFSRLKVRILRFFGAQVGVGVVIKPKVNIKYPWKLKIGNNSWLGECVWIDNLAFVSIGSDVCLSQGAFLLTGNHDFTTSTFDLIIAPIVLEDGVWIGAKAIVAPGVTCKTHAVLSLQSVATKNLEPYSINRGNPAVFVKKRTIDLEGRLP